MHTHTNLTRKQNRGTHSLLRNHSRHGNKIGERTHCREITAVTTSDIGHFRYTISVTWWGRWACAVSPRDCLTFVNMAILSKLVNEPKACIAAVTCVIGSIAYLSTRRRTSKSRQVIWKKSDSLSSRNLLSCCHMFHINTTGVDHNCYAPSVTLHQHQTLCILAFFNAKGMYN